MSLRCDACAWYCTVADYMVERTTTDKVNIS